MSNTPGSARTASRALSPLWMQAWPQALEAWSRYTRLRAPLLCIDSSTAKAAGLSGSFAMIRLVDQTVVIDLQQVADQRLDEYAVEVLAHEIGHHVYAPGSLSDHARCLARVARGLLDRRQHAPMIANLYTDLLINDRLQRSAGLSMAAVFQRLAQIEAAPSTASARPSAVWLVYMRTYEILWSLPRQTLCQVEKLGDDAEGDAQLAARLVRHYARDWLLGAGSYALLMYPHLVADEQAQARNPAHHWHDTGSAGADGQIHGLSCAEDGEGQLPIHPAADPALNGLAAAPDAAPGAKLPSTTAHAGNGGAGQLRTPYEYGELLRLAGVKIDQHEAAVRYYRELAEPHLVRFPSRPRPRSTDPLPEGLEAWDMGMPLDQIDWLGSVLVSPKVIPGLTTLKRTWGHSEGQAPKPKALDLDLYVDSSGSMPNPQGSLSYPALAGAVMCLSALRAGARVQVTLWSSKNQAMSTAGFVRDRHAILRVLTGYYGGGTQFPLPILRDLHAARKAGDPPCHLMCVSDDGASTMFDTPDERGTSGFEVCATALRQAGGGGTLVLNLRADWENTARKTPNSAYGVLLKAREQYGWDLHNVPTLEGLLAFARAFAKRHYAPDIKTVATPEYEA